MEIEKILEEKGKLIDDEIKAVFPQKGVKNLYDAVYYAMPGGKRIRPVLAIAACEALGGDYKKVLPLAAACEVMHNWLLIHDDIEDGDRVRRNRDAVWVKYGLAHGINIGDLMSEKVYELILCSKKRGVDNETVFALMDAMVNAAVKTAEGQAMELNLRCNDRPTEEEYMEMVTAKTACYMTVPIIGGALVAGAGEDIVEKIKKFGYCIGPAFQITDDILDLTKAKGRKEIGRDIKEGKRSLLVVHCLNKCEEKKKLLGVLNKPADATTEEDVIFAKQLFEKYGSLEYAKKKADELVKKAKETSKGMPEKLREVLDYFADYLVNRKK